jgi:hypothetical protein
MADRIFAIEQDKNDIRVQIGNDDSIIPFLKLGFDENVIIEEGTAKAYTETIGSSWIVGVSTNNVVGTNTNTESGNQQVVGGADKDRTIYEIFSMNNTFIENFRDNEYASSGTATWDYTTDYQLELTSGQNYTSTIIAKKPNTIYSKATVFIELNSGSLSDLTVQLSSDGGSNFETVTLGTQYSFTNKSTAGLVWKITSSGTVNVKKVIIIYS